MWYFLPTHPLILNFYYFVNCFTFTFICYYYYIILYIYILFIYLFILFSFSSLLFSLSFSFSPLPTLSPTPHISSIIILLFYFFLFFLPTFQASHFGLSISSPSLRVDNWTTSPEPPFSQFLDFFSLTTPQLRFPIVFLYFSTSFFSFFFLSHSTHGRPTPISFPFYFLLQLVPMPTSPPDSIITVGGVTSAPFLAPFHPHFLHFSSFHFFNLFIFLFIYLFIIFISFLFPKNPSTLTVGRSSANRRRWPLPIFSHSLTFPSHSFSIIIIIIIIIIIKYEIWVNLLLVN